MANYFTGAASIKQPYPMTSVPEGPFGTQGSLEMPAYLTGNRTLFESLPALGGISGRAQASPVMAGSEPPAKTSGWGEQVGSLLQGIGKLGAGLGAGIAAARGMPMAGQMLSSYYEEKTGDKEPGESSLEKALKALREAGLISPIKLDVGDSVAIGSDAGVPSYSGLNIS